MRFLSVSLSLALVLLFSSSPARAEAVVTEQTPVGLWETVDDITGQPKSTLEISETAGRLAGRVIKIYPRGGQDTSKLCDACQGSRHNQPIVGMIIMEGLIADPASPGKWSDGEILDPKSGKTYHCSIQLMDKGRKLKVRGYLGISLFGRTQTWTRIKSAQ